MANPVTTSIVVALGEGDDTRKLGFRGREANALADLLRAGPRGLSSIEHVGPRLSHYVMKLRRAGLAIETVDEEHLGAFPGRHGRYQLRSQVRVVSEARR